MYSGRDRGVARNGTYRHVRSRTHGVAWMNERTYERTPRCGARLRVRHATRVCSIGIIMVDRGARVRNRGLWYTLNKPRPRYPISPTTSKGRWLIALQGAQGREEIETRWRIAADAGFRSPPSRDRSLGAYVRKRGSAGYIRWYRCVWRASTKRPTRSSGPSQESQIGRFAKETIEINQWTYEGMQKFRQQISLKLILFPSGTKIYTIFPLLGFKRIYFSGSFDIQVIYLLNPELKFKARCKSESGYYLELTAK